MATNGAQQSTEKAAGKDKNAQEVNDVPYDRGYAWVVVFGKFTLLESRGLPLSLSLSYSMRLAIPCCLALVIRF